MLVLVDTSIWVAHFHRTNRHLVELLNDGAVIAHPFVTGDLASGTPPSKTQVIGLLTSLECIPAPSSEEILEALAARRLFGTGCGFVGIGLIASVMLRSDTLLWTKDPCLRRLAQELGKCYRPPAAS